MRRAAARMQRPLDAFDETRQARRRATVSAVATFCMAHHMRLGATRDEFRAVLARHARGVLGRAAAWMAAAADVYFGLERWFVWQRGSPAACYAMRYSRNPARSRALHRYRVVRAGELGEAARSELSTRHRQTLRRYCAVRAHRGQSLAGWEWLR
jgi:hypothetical protein